MSTLEVPLFPGDEFDRTAATSIDAAKRDHTIDRERVRQLLVLHPEGLTDWEIADLLGEPMRKGSLGKRRQELGCVKVRDANGDPVRRVCHGSGCFVWKLA